MVVREFINNMKHIKRQNSYQVGNVLNVSVEGMGIGQS
jgi:hypothetical protein